MCKAIDKTMVISDIKLDKTYPNALLFELIKDGHYINPDDYFDKTLREL